MVSQGEGYIGCRERRPSMVNDKYFRGRRRRRRRRREEEEEEEEEGGGVFQGYSSDGQAVVALKLCFS